MRDAANSLRAAGKRKVVEVPDHFDNESSEVESRPTMTSSNRAFSESVFATTYQLVEYIQVSDWTIGIVEMAAFSYGLDFFTSWMNSQWRCIHNHGTECCI